jgi:hypothetical protein
MDSPVFLPARKKRECCSFMLDSSGNGKKKFQVLLDSCIFMQAKTIRVQILLEKKLGNARPLDNDKLILSFYDLKRLCN